jgi:F420-non-reducing hydrogenase small subunit
MSKPKFAMYWSGSCGGCEIAVINIHEKILDVDANFDIAFWPVAMDAKVKDVEALEDGAILLTLWNGSIRNEENEHMAHLLRKKSKILVAFGSCATEGCIPGLANLSPMQEIFDVAYHTISTDNPNNIHPQPMTKVPEGEISIPALKERVQTLAQVEDVDSLTWSFRCSKGKPNCHPKVLSSVLAIPRSVRNARASATLS